MPSSMRLSLLACVAMGLAFAVPNAAAAAEPCKTVKTKTDCAARADCAWVAAYATKKGKKVAAYCRTKAKKKP